MRVGAFQVNEPLPDLNSPHALAILRPWVDVGGVGSLTIKMLESEFNTRPLGKLTRPGNFFDFTRYRPIMRLEHSQRKMSIPNAYINFAKRAEGNDLVFFHLLEPHMFGEVYVESILRVLQIIGAKRYCLLGSMHDAVPHTRPLIVSGIANNELEESLRRLDVQPSDYEGPTTIAALISQEAPKYNIEAMNLIVHLPQYVQLDEDYIGQLRLLEVICSLYDFPIDLEQIKHKSEEQYEKLNKAMEREPQFKQIVHQLETFYESRTGKIDEVMPELSPEIESFLREIGKDFRQN